MATEAPVGASWGCIRGREALLCESLLVCVSVCKCVSVYRNIYMRSVYINVCQYTKNCNSF